MAAFSYQHHNFLLDPVFLSNTHNISENMSAFSEEPNTTSNTCFSQFYPVDFNESSSLENVTNEPSVTNKHSADSSSVDDDKPESGQQVTQKVIITMDKKRKNRDSSVQSKVGPREVKGKNQKKICGVVKDGEEKKTKIDKKKGAEEKAPTGYIHVRARRGQATDSHSLAERVRREKISERMKLLQALVPGCDKVTGKALMLDEIINYVQSLQNQVEFLSMRLSSMNPMLYDFGMDIDSFMVTPEILTGLASPLLPLNVQQSNLVQATAAAFSDITTNFNTPNSYALVDSTTSLLFQQGQSPNILLQDNGQLLWGVDDQRQKLINQSGFSNNNARSFH